MWQFSYRFSNFCSFLSFNFSTTCILFNLFSILNLAFSRSSQHYMDSFFNIRVCCKNHKSTFFQVGKISSARKHCQRQVSNLFYFFYSISKVNWYFLSSFLFVFLNWNLIFWLKKWGRRAMLKNIDRYQLFSTTLVEANFCLTVL